MTHPSVQQQLRRDVEALALPGGRVVASAGHDAARAYIVERLRALGLSPYRNASFELPYSMEGGDFVNIAACRPGEAPELPPLLVYAHYDTCGEQPGADDNAAAVAIALCVAERMIAAPGRRHVVFCFADAEEPPHFLTPSMGSIYFYERQRLTDFHCAIAMDLVGHDVPVAGLEEALFIAGMESDPGLEQAIVQCAPPPGLEPLPTLTRYIGDLSDYAVHRREKKPYLFLTCAHWEHYHEPTDTPDLLNYAKMEAIATYLLSLLHFLDTQPLEGPFEGYDTTSTELAFMRRSVGPIVESLGMRLNDRSDIDSLAALMLHVFGL